MKTHPPVRLSDNTKSDGRTLSAEDIALMSRASKSEEQVKQEIQLATKAHKKLREEFYKNSELDQIAIMKRLADNNY